MLLRVILFTDIYSLRLTKTQYNIFDLQKIQLCKCNLFLEATCVPHTKLWLDINVEAVHLILLGLALFLFFFNNYYTVWVCFHKLTLSKQILPTYLPLWTLCNPKSLMYLQYVNVSIIFKIEYIFQFFYGTFSIFIIQILHVPISTVRFFYIINIC